MRVLVVEDEPTMLSALADALTHERLAVDTALGYFERLVAELDELL